MIRLKSGETIRPEELMETLVGYGFERTDFVYEPGQFALRGGILDIYSFGNEKPYRVELFGNEVDSIRIFDPETQLSERRLLQVQIIPNIETHFSAEKKISLFEFLPENTVIWMQDRRFIREKTAILENDLSGFTWNPGIPGKRRRLRERLRKLFQQEISSGHPRSMQFQKAGILWNSVPGSTCRCFCYRISYHAPARI